MKRNEPDLEKGRVITQESGIQIIAYDRNETEIIYRYVDVSTNREVLRTKENTKNGLHSVIEMNRDYWDIYIDDVEVGDTDFELETPYKVSTLLEDRVLEITTI